MFLDNNAEPSRGNGRKLALGSVLAIAALFSVKAGLKYLDHHPEMIGGVGQEGWSYSSGTDPMTDLSYVQASREFDDGTFKISVSLRCSNMRNLQYTMSSFLPSGEPAPMKLVSDDRGAVTMPFEMRIGAGSVHSLFASGAKYSNQLVVPLARKDGTNVIAGFMQSLAGISYEDARSADVLTFRLQLANGESVVRLDQSDETVRRVLSSCTPDIQTQREEDDPPDAVQASATETPSQEEQVSEQRPVEEAPADEINGTANEGEAPTEAPQEERPL